MKRECFGYHLLSLIVCLGIIKLNQLIEGDVCMKVSFKHVLYLVLGLMFVVGFIGMLNNSGSAFFYWCAMIPLSVFCFISLAQLTKKASSSVLGSIAWFIFMPLIFAALSSSLFFVFGMHSPLASYSAIFQAIVILISWLFMGVYGSIKEIKLALMVISAFFFIITFSAISIIDIIPSQMLLDNFPFLTQFSTNFSSPNSILNFAIKVFGMTPVFLSIITFTLVKFREYGFTPKFTFFNFDFSKGIL